MGHIRGHGVTRLLVYCESLWCNHSASLEADWLSDDTILLTLDRRMVCTACGHRRRRRSRAELNHRTGCRDYELTNGGRTALQEPSFANPA